MIIETREFPVAVRLSDVTVASVEDGRKNGRGWMLYVSLRGGSLHTLEFDDEAVAMKYLAAIEASFGEPVVADITYGAVKFDVGTKELG